MSNSNNNQPQDSVTLRTSYLAPGPYVFRAIPESTVRLRPLLRDLSFRQRDFQTPVLNDDEYFKHQIETSRNEVAIATFTSELGLDQSVDYLFQIIDSKTNKPIRTYTRDFVRVRRRTYTWEFDGRDYLSHLGERPFAADGLYTGRVQLRSGGEITTILFDQPIRVVRRAARLLAMDGNRGPASLALMGRLTSVGSPVPVSNILEPIARKSYEFIDLLKASASDFSIVKSIFQRASVNSDSADLLFYFGSADPMGRLKTVTGTLSADSILFDPIDDKSHLRWDRLRWLILMAPNCLSLHSVEWRSRSAVRQIVPTTGQTKVPDAMQLLTVLHPGIHWLNALRSSGLRGVLGYWGPIVTDIQDPSIRWALRMLIEDLERGEPFVTAWRAANSAASVGWAAFVREDGAEDTLGQMASGLSTSSSGWRYWDQFHEHQNPSTVYQELSQFSKSYKVNVAPEFDPRYDKNVANQQVPDEFDIYNDGATL